jgi:hypothetical protein
MGAMEANYTANGCRGHFLCKVRKACNAYNADSPGCSTVAVNGPQVLRRGSYVWGRFRIPIKNSEARLEGFEPPTRGLGNRCSIP